ncbi:MAG: TIGR04282 family arsenosugar biosynthesis glycosyltransferase [Gammaproteobacteria bacterium]
MKYPHARILVFSKAPEPGRVKTRLIATLGAGGAADLYRELLCSTLEMVTGSALCPVELWCSPAMADPFFEQCRQQYAVQLHEQVQGDLGGRMSHALQAAGKPEQPVLLIGADCPTLCAADLDEALTWLERDAGVVLGPAEDGGYYLIGMRGRYPYVFDDVPWSTPAVLELTKARLQQRRVKLHCLTRRRDLDTADDYRAWLECCGNVINGLPPGVPL